MEKYRSKRAKPVVSLGLECMKITFPSPTSLPFRLCFSHTVSISSLSPSPLPPLPPSLSPPAAYKHTAHFCLAARRLACSLEPAAEDREDLRHACGCLPTCLCVLDHWCLYPAALCVCVRIRVCVCVFSVHACLRAEIG